MNKSQGKKTISDKCSCYECNTNAITWLCLGGSKKPKHKFTNSEQIKFKVCYYAGDICIPVCRAHKKVFELYFSRTKPKKEVTTTTR